MGVASFYLPLPEGQVAGVVPKLLALGVDDISVTSPLSLLNTQPVAGTIAMGSAFGLECGFAAGFKALGCTVITGNRASVQTTSLLRGSEGLGGKPPRPVIVKLLPPLATAAQLEATSLGVSGTTVGRVAKARLGSISGALIVTVPG